MSLFECVGVVTGILGVWLTTRQKIWCWPVGLISVLAFIVVFYEAKLYGAMALQAVYVVLVIYGWYAWLHGGEDAGELLVSPMPRRLLAMLTGTGAVVTLVLAVGLRGRTDESSPVVDAFTTSFSLLAQWMQTRKHLENWLVWLVVDVAYVWMSLSQGLRLTAGLYLVYVVLAIVGYRDWRRSMIASGVPA